MAETIVTSDRITKDPDGRQLIEYLYEESEDLRLSDALIYYDFPTYNDYESRTLKPDVLIFSPVHGIVAMRLVRHSSVFSVELEPLEQIDRQLEDFTSNLEGRLLRSRFLRRSRRDLKFRVEPLILLVDGDDKFGETDLSCSLVFSYQGLSDFLNEMYGDAIGDTEIEEVRSVIEGGKAISRSQRRTVANPDIETYAVALSQLEDEIANFDAKQRQVALSLIQGPQRIRGLAGSGKTIILAMKAAHIHLTHPNARVLVTFYTRSLQTLFVTLITRFYRHYKEEDPDWSQVQVRHAWGGTSRPGAYTDACKRAEQRPLNLSEARSGSTRDPFGYVCRELISKAVIDPYFDYALIDEGQDFPSAFYELAFMMTKGVRNKKNVIWAYDELQNIMDVQLKTPAQLFGLDADGEPRIDLERAHAELPTGAENDTVLSKCYRNQREVLVVAHALGFGCYGEQIVQMLQNKEHWQDVGYKITSNGFETGREVVIFRPEENSPLSLAKHDISDLVEAVAAKSFNEELGWIARETQEFLKQGLKPEDILIVALDDRNAKGYFRALSERLASLGYETNNIIADPYSEPPFAIEGKITLSTVYRAKGHEAAVVFAAGVDAVDRSRRGGRNRLFAAFTRSNAWLRISGVGENAHAIEAEVRRAMDEFPNLRFVMPDTDEVETIQRDRTERAAKAQQIREKYLGELREEGFNEEEIGRILAAERVDE